MVEQMKGKKKRLIIFVLKIHTIAMIIFTDTAYGFIGLFRGFATFALILVLGFSFLILLIQLIRLPRKFYFFKKSESLDERTKYKKKLIVGILIFALNCVVQVISWSFLVMRW